MARPVRTVKAPRRSQDAGVQVVLGAIIAVREDGRGRAIWGLVK